MSGCLTLKKGSKGNITKLLQQKLISLGYDLGKYGADGVFGTDTYNAVVKF
ncbi:peptidoglycan-binding domain-containing protein [Clostridium cuniculi]|uniref:peptidoglycan-binding domain-containing protein n=1 Tax=Clostridium cuniculi TaxID=2548455 RepID=UPI003B8360CF